MELLLTLRFPKKGDEAETEHIKCGHTCHQCGNYQKEWMLVAGHGKDLILAPNPERGKIPLIDKEAIMKVIAVIFIFL